MFRDLWNAKVRSVQGHSAIIRKEIAEIERKVDQLMERVIDAASPSIVKNYDRKIQELEIQKAMLVDNLARMAKPVRTFNVTYRTAFSFLANPLKLWLSPRIEDRRAVLKLVFSERLAYVRGEGYRTANLSMPFKALEGDKMLKKGT